MLTSMTTPPLMSSTPMQQPLLNRIDIAFGTVDYSAGIIDDVATAAANGTLTTDATTYVDTTVDVEINDAATIAQIKGISLPSALSITPLASLMTANLAAANCNFTTDATTYVDTTVDVEINDAATIAQIKH